jgi:hypothetical protein
MTPAVHIGIDPGLSGAIACIDTEGALLWVEDMPTLAGEVDPRSLHELLADEYIDCTHIEVVSIRPGEGGQRSLKTGTNYGIVLAVAKMSGSVERVTPAVWKKAMGVTADKETSLRRARELWPSKADQFAGPRGGGKDGRAEAALIALHGLRRWRGERGGK